MSSSPIGGVTSLSPTSLAQTQAAPAQLPSTPPVSLARGAEAAPEPKAPIAPSTTRRGDDAATRPLDPQVAADARARTRNDLQVILRESRTRGALKPKAVPPGSGPFTPLPSLTNMPTTPGRALDASGGKGGLMRSESKTATEKALAAEGQPSPAHPYAKERAETRRRFDQAGLPRTGGGVIYVQDIDPDHAAAIARTVGGKTALAAGADLRTEAPSKAEAAGAEPTKRDEKGVAWARANPKATVDDLAKVKATGLVDSVSELATPVRAATADAGKLGGDEKVFMNLSYGSSPEIAANEMVRTMMLAPEGTALHARAKAVLGEEPRRTVEGDRTLLDFGQATRLKKEVVYPALDRAMAAPEHQAAMSAATGDLQLALDAAWRSNVMVFQAANNERGTAEAAGRPDMASSPTAGLRHLFRVGAAKPNGPGTADDEVAPFSGAGEITASTTGMGIPVGLDASGNVRDVSGTSFASPLMAETAYLVNAANPKLSLDQIQGILTDPRVARDIPGTHLDGAGVVDPFAAAAIARNPRLTALDLDRLRAELDQDPGARLDLLERR